MANLGEVKEKYDALAESIKKSKKSISDTAKGIKNLMDGLTGLQKPLGDYVRLQKDLNPWLAANTEAMLAQVAVLVKTSEAVGEQAKVEKKIRVNKKASNKATKEETTAIEQLLELKRAEIETAKEKAESDVELLDGTTRYKDELMNLRSEIGSIMEITK